MGREPRLVWTDLMHPEDRERVATTIRGAPANGPITEVEYRALRADGSYAWILSRLRKLVADDGSIWVPRRRAGRDGAPRGRGPASQARYRACACRGARGVAPTDRRGRRRGPPTTRARPPRRRSAAADRVADDATTRRGEGRGSSDSSARRARRSSTSGKASPSCASSRAAFIRAASPRGARAWSGVACGAGAAAVDVDVPATRLPQSVETALYFTVAETLTNVAKHANAARATVTVSMADGCATAEIGDDGRGGATTGGGSGLRGLGRPARGDRWCDRDGEP